MLYFLIAVFLIIGVLVITIVLTLAELSSYFKDSGGPVLFTTTAFGARLHIPKHPDCSTVHVPPTAPASSSISSSTDSAPCLRHEPA